MPRPSINASNDELANEMARGAKSGSTSRSAGNIMPGANALSGGGARAPSGGATSALKGIPSRVGAPPSAAGSYMPQPGSPAGATAAVTPGTVPGSSLGGASKATLAMLQHGRTLGAVAHLRKIGGDHPMLAQHHAKASAGIAGYKNTMKTQMPKPPKFGALGGSSGSSDGGSLVPSAGLNAAGMAPLGMAKLPDEM